MKHGHLTLPTYVYSEPSQHITAPRPSWHELGLPRVNDWRAEPDTNNYKRNPHTGFYAVGPEDDYFRVRFRYQGKVHQVGCFDTAGEGARAYDAYVIREGLLGRPLNLTTWEGI